MTRNLRETHQLSLLPVGSVVCAHRNRLQYEGTHLAAGGLVDDLLNGAIGDPDDHFPGRLGPVRVFEGAPVQEE